MGGAGGAVLVFRTVDAQTAAMERPERPNLPKVTDVIRTVADRFASFAEVKSIHIETDVPVDLGEQLADHHELADALAVLVDNSLNYVPSGGQVIVGVRWMEHKEKPLLLFFVMDNGPLVPEKLRQVIFEPGFVCNPASSQRTGRDLYKARDFAVAHAGSVWVDSKSGKACTFFMRVRPDGAR
jgi:signal transduction histidine kinase